MSLHNKQLQILCRGLHLLKPGGRLVYSTCSMNPVENEASSNMAGKANVNCKAAFWVRLSSQLPWRDSARTLKLQLGLSKHSCLRSKLRELPNVLRMMRG